MGTVECRSEFDRDFYEDRWRDGKTAAQRLGVLCATLRAIGQDHADLYPDQFEIQQVSEGGTVVDGALGLLTTDGCCDVHWEFHDKGGPFSQACASSRDSPSV